MESKLVDGIILASIDGYPDYWISRCGKVWSDAGRGCFLKPWVSNGYYQVKLYDGRKRKNHKIHRLVASAFIPNPHNKEQINHKSGKRADNSVANLEWVTCSENHLHAYRTLGRKNVWRGKFGHDNHSSKPVIQMNLDGLEVAMFGSAHEAERAGFDHSHIGRCCRNTQKTHAGYRWKFA